jgi:hypothetical protein
VAISMPQTAPATKPSSGLWWHSRPRNRRWPPPASCLRHPG